jgi:CheY-like chemotaxis protein
MDCELGTPIEILLVEDNPGDVRLTVEALANAKMEAHLTVAPDGVEALSLLRGIPPRQKAGHFDLILLDLNLPRKNGREVLVELKNDPELKHIPVIILTTSKAEEDICTAYAAQANCYVTKPVGFKAFMRVIQSIGDFWFSVATLPGRDAHGCRFNSNTAYRG